MTTTTTTPAHVAASPGGEATGSGFLTATGQTTRRTLLQFLRTPQLLFLPTILGAMFLFIFRYIFGGAIDTGTAVDYVDFLVPGFLVATILWTGMGVPAGVAEDATSGVHDRLRSLPIPRSAVMAGRSLADTALNSWALLVTAALGLAVGFRTHGDPGAVVVAIALLLVAEYAFSWVFVSLGLVAGNAQSAQGLATLVVVPLTFISSAYVPLHSMPGWMQSFAANQPVTVIINAVRSLMLGGTTPAGIGHSTTYWVTLSLVWCAGITVVFASLAVARFSRTR
jgi:ABC-2 type transport system permease protein